MKKKCRVPILLLYGIIFLLLGVLLVVDKLIDLAIIRTYWPLVVVVLILPLLIAVACNRTALAILIIPICVLAMLGFILWLQGFFHLWHTWAYAWALLIFAIGLGMLLLGGLIKVRDLRPWAGAFILVGLVLFLFLGGIFELGLNLGNGHPVVVYWLAGGLICLGITFLLLRWFFGPHKRNLPTFIPDQPAPQEPNEEPEVMELPEMPIRAEMDQRMEPSENE